ncbi:MAG: hypothetical protein ACRDTJ_29415, partial [Pseudonocardiaceae bacterium]
MSNLPTVHKATSDPRVRNLEIKLKKVRDFLAKDATAPVPRLTAAERQNLQDLLDTAGPGSDLQQLAKDFPALDTAVEDIVTLGTRPIVIPEDLNLDEGQPPLPTAEQDEIERQVKEALDKYGKMQAAKSGLERVGVLQFRNRLRTARYVL